MQRTWLLFMLFGALLMASSAHAGADAAARKRRQRPGSSSSGSSNSGSSNSGSSNSGGQVTRPAKPQGNSSANTGGSLDDQINATRARIRVHRRATSEAVDRANLNGTIIFIPGGNAAGAVVSFTSKHAGKTVRGKVKATGTGEKATATITAARAK